MVLKFTRMISIVAVIIVAGGFAFKGLSSVNQPVPIEQGDYSSILEGSRGQVLLFSTPWCPNCGKMKALLDEMSIEYVDMDIESSEDARDLFERLDVKEVPVVVTSEVKITGYWPALVEQHIQQKVLLSAL